MAKQEPKITVIQHLTESQIKSIGGNRWIRRKMKRLLLICGVCVVWAVAVGFLLDNSKPTTVWVAMSPIVLLYLIGLVTFNKAGQIFYNEVKDKPEPIDLDEIK